MVKNTASYLHKVINQGTARRQIIADAIAYLTEAKRLMGFDAIAMCGSSGLLVGPSVADALDIEIILVRKTLAGNHAPHLVEGLIWPDMSYVIIDDFMESGATIEYVVGELNKCEKMTCAGVYLYDDQVLRTASLNEDNNDIVIFQTHDGGRGEKHRITKPMSMNLFLD